MKKLISILIFLSFMLALPLSVAIASTNIINEYDANGNLVTGDGKYYEYNDANQLVRVRQGDQTGTVIAEYFYDFAGRRVKKIENGVTTYYVGSHYEKQVGGSNAGDNKYYFAGGDRVARKDPSGNIQYYHLDHLGGTNAVTDQAGNVIATINYYPFGETKPGSSVNEKYSYTGKEKDNTPGLYYFKTRYNHPEFRHFTQPDTIIPDLSNPQSLNRYSYVENNPVSYVDPDGHKKKKKKRKKRGGLSKREYKCKKMGLNPDKCKKKLKKKKKKRGGLSKREYWMIAHGRNPDKDKTPLKVAKKQYKAANQSTAKIFSSNITVQHQGSEVEIISDVTSNTDAVNVKAEESFGPYNSNNNSVENKRPNVQHSCEDVVSSLYHINDPIRDRILCFALPMPTLGQNTIIKGGAEQISTALGCPGCVNGGLAVFGISLGVSYYFIDNLIYSTEELFF